MIRCGDGVGLQGMARRCAPKRPRMIVSQMSRAWIRTSPPARHWPRTFSIARLVTMVLTFEDVAKFDQLEHDRYRVLAQGYTTSQIPINADHEKWLEYKELKKRLNSPQSRAAPGNEHAAAQPASPPLTNLMAMTRSTFPNQEQNMMLDLLLGSASHVSSKVCLYRVLFETHSCRASRWHMRQVLSPTYACKQWRPFWPTVRATSAITSMKYIHLVGIAVPSWRTACYQRLSMGWKDPEPLLQAQRPL